MCVYRGVSGGGAGDGGRDFIIERERERERESEAERPRRQVPVAIGTKRDRVKQQMIHNEYEGPG